VVEHHEGVTRGGVVIDDFAKKSIRAAYKSCDPQRMERLLREWIDLRFQAQYKKDVPSKEPWHFDGDRVPPDAQEKITAYAIQFYKDLAEYTHEYYKRQCEALGVVQVCLMITLAKDNANYVDRQWCLQAVFLPRRCSKLKCIVCKGLGISVLRSSFRPMILWPG